MRSDTASGARPIIEIEHVTRRFGETVIAVDDVTLDIREGEFFALLGPSGCGKTTLLRMIAGFETLTSGSIRIDGQDIVGVPPNKRPVNMVFQSYAVFPHMTVADNVGYGLKVTGVSKAERAALVEEALGLVKLDGLGGRKPDQLSGGQRQRVALARALVKRPKVLLLDEPLSALDAKLREAMQLELVRLQQNVGITFIIVTHDQHEALSMADRIAVMDAGQVRQVAPPAELYEFPTSRFVADFIGKMNLFEGKVEQRDTSTLMVAVDGLGTIALPTDADISGPVGIAVRPEKVRLSAEKPDARMIALAGKVSEVAYLGNESHVYLETESGLRVNVVVKNETRSIDPSARLGETLWAAWTPRDTLVLRD